MKHIRGKNTCPSLTLKYTYTNLFQSQSLGAGIKKIVQGAEKSMKPALEAVKKFGPTVVEGALPLAGFIPFPHSHQNQNQTQQR